MNTIEYAKEELKRCGYAMDGTDDPYNQMAIDAILEIVEVFSKQGHTGFSAGYVINAITKLLSHEPLTPLTGADDEWNDIGEGNFQNKRCSRVFKNQDGQTYDINGKVFTDKTGCSYTNRHSKVNVVFPYVPTTEYIQVEE